MKILVLIAAAILVPMLVIFALAAMKPKHFSVKRSARIQATPETLFLLINNLRNWEAWSPYLKDPAMETAYSGPDQGPGALYRWNGNKDVGQGSVQIVDATMPSRIRLQLDIVKPFEGHNRVDFTLTPVGPETEVTWAIQGPSPFMARLASFFIDMDKMIGTDFERGLANLKAAAEQARSAA